MYLPMIVDEVEPIRELGKIMVILLYKKIISSNTKLLMQQEVDEYLKYSFYPHVLLRFL